MCIPPSSLFQAGPPLSPFKVHSPFFALTVLFPPSFTDSLSHWFFPSTFDYENFYGLSKIYRLVKWTPRNNEIYIKCSIEWAYQFIHLCSPNPLSRPWNSITTKHYALCLFFGNPDLQHHPKRQLFFPIWNESSVDVVSALRISVKSRWLMVFRSLMTSLSCIHLNRFYQLLRKVCCNLHLIL